ncbi:MAG: hypothetical protein HeimC2_21760 [Candidatus Heimdallarchaeota archaeon LC_2]|nr:MAG: hypothetical protein HeimC2_21760 [Candidatus Heimdallarchaeota archaeon LC_2]
MALEGALYEAVTNYLVKKTGGDPHYAGYTHSPGVKPDTAKFLQIDHFGSSIEPDVFILTPEDEIILCEGKGDISGKNLEIAVGQGLVYQQYSHFTYLFFPYSEVVSQEQGMERIKSYVEKHGFGLLLVKDDGEIVEENSPQLTLEKSSPIEIKKMITNIVKTRETLLNLNPFMFQDPNDLSGCRAFIIRDFCKFVEETNIIKKSIEETQIEFDAWLRLKFNNNEDLINQYAGAQMGRSKFETRIKAGLQGAIFFNFAAIGNSGSLELTHLGKILATQTKNTGMPELAQSERIVFFVLATQRKYSQRFIELTANSTSPFDLHRHDCGHQVSTTLKDDFYECSDCNAKLSFDQLSATEKYIQTWGKQDYHYWHQVFWFRSGVFTKGKKKIEFYGP